MKVINAIENILKETLPDTINGIHIKFDLREVQSLVYHDTKDYILTLMPVEINCENVAVSLKISPDTFPLDFDETSLAYKHLQKQIEEMLMMYMRNINKWCGDCRTKETTTAWHDAGEELPTTNLSCLIAYQKVDIFTGKYSKTVHFMLCDYLPEYKHWNIKEPINVLKWMMLAQNSTELANELRKKWDIKK